MFQRYSALPRKARIVFAVDHEPEATPARRWESKIGGAPYLPKGAPWPMRPVPASCAASPLPSVRVRAERETEPLAFLAQVNLGHVEAWRLAHGAAPVLDGRLPTRGILQFFIPCEVGWGYEDRVDGWGRAHCQYVADVVEDDAALEPAQVVVEADGGRLETAPEAQVAERYGPKGWLQSVGHGGESTPLMQPCLPLRLVPQVESSTPHLPHPWTVECPDDLRGITDLEGTPDAPSGLDELFSRHVARGGIQLGGYPYFTQDDPRAKDPGPRRVLLFQLDSAEGVSIGDAGIMSFFVPEEDLAAGDLRRVGMTWDCC